MKKTLTYTANRGKSLTLKDLAELTLDAERIDISMWAVPEVVLTTDNGTKRRAGSLKSVTVERYS